MIDTPALRLMTTVFPSIIQQETQVGDVTGGYGVSKNHYVKVIVLCEQCRLCKELSLTEDYHPNGSCHHQWRHVKHEVCTVNGATPDDALNEANRVTAGFLRLVAKRTPELSPKFLELLLETRVSP